jgi:hypothetical protein
MTTDTQDAATTLYWDREGTIACKAHAPPRESDVWGLDRWEPMGPDTVALYTAEEGRAPACECCAAIARRRGGAS